MKTSSSDRLSKASSSIIRWGNFLCMTSRHSATTYSQMTRVWSVPAISTALAGVESGLYTAEIRTFVSGITRRVLFPIPYCHNIGKDIFIAPCFVCYCLLGSAQIA